VAALLEAAGAASVQAVQEAEEKLAMKVGFHQRAVILEFCYLSRSFVSTMSPSARSIPGCLMPMLAAQSHARQPPLALLSP